MEEEKNIEELSGDENSFYVKDSGNIFGIAFDKLFKMDSIELYDDFELTAKRNFKNLAPQILETYQELFLTNDGEFDETYDLILFNILNIKWQIMTKTGSEVTSYEKFIAMIDKITDDGNKLLLKRIDDYVEENYQLDLDKITQETKEKKKKVNEELQFLDSHAKALLKIAYLYRIMIPIISVYFIYNKDNLMSVSTVISNDEEVEDAKEMEFDEVNSKIFAYLFEKFAKNPKALRNKLYRLTYSRISKTAYSDKRFWAAAKNVGITKETEALEIYKKLLTNALPKLSIQKDRNVISFLQSVINNQIDFLFQNKFKHKLIPLTLEGNNSKYSTEDSDDDDSVSEFEKMELLTTRRDEGSYIIRKLNINDVVPKIPEKFNVGVDDAEVREMMKKLSRNSIQENIISMLTFKYFNDKDALKYISFYQYCYLVVACKKFLELKKFKYLPRMLVAKCEKQKDRTTIVGKKLRPEIISSKKYSDLFKDKYINFSNEIEGPFFSIVGTIYSSIFTDDEGKNIFEGEKAGKVAEEMLDLARLI